MKEKFFKIFANCLIVRGNKRSLILDIQRESSRLIPDTMNDVIDLLKSKKSIVQIYEHYGYENKSVVDEYLQFLDENEFGFFCDFEEFDLFPEIDTTFHNPSIVTNAIIELSKNTIPFFKQIVISLNKVKCKYIEIISFDEISKNELLEILTLSKDKDFRSIELVLKYNKYYDDEFIKSLDSYNFAITNLILHSSEYEKNHKYSELSFFDVQFTTKNISSFKHCGIIDLKYFNTNMPKVLESINHNSCLNRKISIDKNGNIKNCPSMAQSFGNIKDTTLEEALNHPDFKKYWNVTKDQIEVCKDCEFRHICTDCRAYTERTHFEGDTDLSKPLKCGYNPYTNEWAEWSTNPFKQKAIEYYGMQELVKND